MRKKSSYRYSYFHTKDARTEHEYFTENGGRPGFVHIGVCNNMYINIYCGLTIVA